MLLSVALVCFFCSSIARCLSVCVVSVCLCLVSMSASQQASPIYLTRLPFAACSFGVAAGCTYRYSDGREPASQPAQCAPRQISTLHNTSREEAAGNWCARECDIWRGGQIESESWLSHARVSSTCGLLPGTAARTYLVTRAGEIVRSLATTAKLRTPGVCTGDSARREVAARPYTVCIGIMCVCARLLLRCSGQTLWESVRANQRDQIERERALELCVRLCRCR